MFARAANPFDDFEGTTSNETEEKNLKERVEEMVNVVYPAINKKIRDENVKRAETFNKTRRMAKFQTKSWVSIKNELIESKLADRYTGPFKVIRVNSGGAYELQGENGSKYKDH